MEVCSDCTNTLDDTNTGCIYDDTALCKDCWWYECECCREKLPIISGPYNREIGSKNRPYCQECMCGICGLYAWNEDDGMTCPITNEMLSFFHCEECDKPMCIHGAAVVECE